MCHNFMLYYIALGWLYYIASLLYLLKKQNLCLVLKLEIKFKLEIKKVSEEKSFAHAVIRSHIFMV